MANSPLCLSTYLPLLHIVLLGLVLLREFHKDFVHVVGIRLQLREHVADCALHQHAVDHAEAFARAGEGCEGVEDESGRGGQFVEPG